MPKAPIERLAGLRLDGDLYESTIQALDSLYNKLSVGGFVIVDDYGNVAACRQAVHDFREKRDHTSNPADRLGGSVPAASRRSRFRDREVASGGKHSAAVADQQGPRNLQASTREPTATSPDATWPSLRENAAATRRRSACGGPFWPNALATEMRSGI